MSLSAVAECDTWPALLVSVWSCIETQLAPDNTACSRTTVIRLPTVGDCALHRTMHQKMQALMKGETQVDQASQDGSGAVRVRTDSAASHFLVESPDDIGHQLPLRRA